MNYILNVYNLENLLFLNVVSVQMEFAHFYFRTNIGMIRIKHYLNLEKQAYLRHEIQGGFKGTVVNRELPSLHGKGHVKLTYSLKIFRYLTSFNASHLKY